MNIQQASTWFFGLPGRWQERFLVLLLHNLTVAARDTYDPQTDALAHPARMRDYNEVYHRVSAFLREVMEDGAERYGGDFWIGPWLFEPRKDSRANDGLWWAWRISAQSIDRQMTDEPETIRINPQTPKRLGA